MDSAEPQESTGELDQAEVIECVLVIANEDCTALGQPAQSALHNPAAWPVLVLPTRDGFFLTDFADVRGITVLGCGLSARRVVVSLVQAQVLRRALGRYGTFHHNGFDGGFQELAVMDVRTVDHGTQRTAIGFDD